MPRQPGDVDITFADISKAKKLLGWRPKIKIEQGMKKFVEWYLKTRQRNRGCLKTQVSTPLKYEGKNDLGLFKPIYLRAFAE